MYRLEYLPEAVADILEAEAYLYELSPPAADQFAEAVEKLAATLTENPFVCQVSRHDESLRCMSLPYRYLCFYYVDESKNLVQVYRILRGMRDIANIL